MRVGDKLKCKKMCISYHGKDIIFENNKEYNIFNVGNRYIEMQYTEDKCTCSFDTLDVNSTYYLYNYFYKPVEIRKMKIKTILDESR